MKQVKSYLSISHTAGLGFLVVVLRSRGRSKTSLQASCESEDVKPLEFIPLECDLYSLQQDHARHMSLGGKGQVINQLLQAQLGRPSPSFLESDTGVIRKSSP